MSIPIRVTEEAFYEITLKSFAEPARYLYLKAKSLEAEELYPLVLKTLREILKYYKNNKDVDVKEKVSVLTEIANLLRDKLRKYEAAIRYHQKAIRLCKEANKEYRKLMVMTSINLAGIGETYANPKYTGVSIEKAIRYFKRAIEVSKKIGDTKRVILNYIRCGCVHRFHGFIKKALEGFGTAKEICEKYVYEYEYFLYLVSIYTLIGETHLYYRLGFKEAIQAYSTVLHLANTQKERWERRIENREGDLFLNNLILKEIKEIIGQARTFISLSEAEEENFHAINFEDSN